jgi:hypothetical protein
MVPLNAPFLFFKKMEIFRQNDMVLTENDGKMTKSEKFCADLKKIMYI